MKKHKFLSISEVAKQPNTTPVWAINNSPLSVIERAGEITIPVPKPNGAGYNHLFIQMTWLPIDLTAQIPRDQLLQSVELRRAISDGLIGLISEEDAEALNSEPGANRERKRLAELRKQQTDINRALSEDNVQAEVSGRSRSPKTKFDQSFTNWVERMAQQPDRKIVNEIRIRRVFKLSQIKYMIANFKNKPEALGVLTEMLEQRRAAKRKKKQASA